MKAFSFLISLPQEVSSNFVQPLNYWGIWKIDSIYVGRASRTEFISVNLPPKERYCDLHQASFFSHFSTIGCQMSMAPDFAPKGMPKYTDGRVPITPPKVYERCSISGTTLIGYKWLLFQFISSPNMASK